MLGWWLLLLCQTLSVFASSTTRIENILVKFQDDIADSLKTKANTLRNILIALDFKRSDDVRKAITKLEEFSKASEASLEVRLGNMNKSLKELMKEIHGGRTTGSSRSTRASSRTTRPAARTRAAPARPIRRQTGPIPRRAPSRYYDTSDEDDSLYDGYSDEEDYSLEDRVDELGRDLHRYRSHRRRYR